MASHPALYGGIMVGAAIWIEIFTVAILAQGYTWIIVIPALFLIAGLFVAGATKEQAEFWELAGGGICIAIATGFVGWFWFIVSPIIGLDLRYASLASLGAGILILIGLVFILGGEKQSY
ncbi:MAG: hypothetical protein ACFFCO_04400 [Promethearchaeota archaeon]